MFFETQCTLHSLCTRNSSYTFWHHISVYIVVVVVVVIIITTIVVIVVVVIVVVLLTFLTVELYTPLL